MSGTFSTAAGALRIVIPFDDVFGLNLSQLAPGGAAEAQERYSEPLFIRCDVG